MTHQREADAAFAELRTKRSGRWHLEHKMHSRLRIISGTAAGKVLASSQVSGWEDACAAGHTGACRVWNSRLSSPTLCVCVHTCVRAAFTSRLVYELWDGHSLALQLLSECCACAAAGVQGGLTRPMMEKVRAALFSMVQVR